MVSTHVFFVQAKRRRGGDKKSYLLFPELQWGGGDIFYRKKGLFSTKANILSLHVLYLENNWISFICFPLLSCPRSNCSDSAASSSMCAVNSCPFHLRSLNDFKKKEKWRLKKQEGGIKISRPCDHPCFTSSTLTTHLCKWFYMPGPSRKDNLLSQACSQSAVHPRPPQHFVPLVFEHTRCNPYTLLSSKQNPVINKTNSDWGKQLRENHQFFKPLK